MIGIQNWSRAPRRSKGSGDGIVVVLALLVLIAALAVGAWADSVPPQAPAVETR